MHYNCSKAASNCDVHWLTVDKAEWLAALSTLSGQTIPPTVRIELDDDDGSIWLEWQTPKAAE